MFRYPIALAVVALCVSVAPAGAQVEEPSGVILRCAPRDSTWSPNTVPEHVRRCKERQTAMLILSPVSGYIGGILLHSLFGGPWEGPKPANHGEIRHRWGMFGAVAALGGAVYEAQRVRCEEMPLRERGPLPRNPRQRPW